MSAATPRAAEHALCSSTPSRSSRARCWRSRQKAAASLRWKGWRSPHAHARIKSVDTAAASGMPGVIAVVTGELMAQHKLAWMPTLGYDTQAVLATDKVRFQGQEVAAVIADTKYQAEDARDAIVVEYDVLPAVTSPDVAKGAGAQLI